MSKMPVDFCKTSADFRIKVVEISYLMLKKVKIGAFLSI